MKLLTLISVVAVSTCVYAETNSPAQKLTPEQAEAMRQQRIMKRFGGFIARKGSQQGQITYVNCQTKAPKAWLEESIAYLKKMSRFNIVCKDGTFDFANPKIEGNASLFIVDDPKLPALLVAPENRWALVNIAVVAKEQRPAFFHARVKKQLSRGFAYLCGAANSQFKDTLVRAIVDEADLDYNVDDQLPIDLFQRFPGYMEKLGVKPAQYATYKKACEEGWAPAPTNDFQKAVWDKVHEIPTKPIKIEYNEKRDKGK